MAYYQITTAESGRCLERLVEDTYDANGNIVTNVLGPWQVCKKRHVGIEGKGSLSGPEMPKRMLLTTEQSEDSKLNILLVSVIASLVIIIIWKLS